MGVVSKTIFCEGKTDIPLLNKIVDGISDAPPIISVGGKFNFSLFAMGYFSAKKKEEDQGVNARYIIFRDRDFDIKPTDTVELFRPDERKPIFLTHRTCIENYLLEPDLIDNWWRYRYEEKIENPSSSWSHKESPGVEKISEWLKTSAETLKDYQAVRWALGDLSKGAERKQLKTTWTDGSGHLPDSLSINDCKTYALNLINDFRQVVDAVTPENFETSIAEYQQMFDQSEFWQQKKYLIWFNGKDIQKAMQKQNAQYPSLKNFYERAIDLLDINQHPDLMQLRQEIENL